MMFKRILVLVLAAFLISLGWIEASGSLGISGHVYWDAFYDISTKLLCGAIISFLFYFLLVEIPTLRKRNVVKSNTLHRYHLIKENILREFISVSIVGGRDDLNLNEDTVQNLMRPEGFKKEFTGYEPNGGIGPFRNQIDAGGPEYERIIFELKTLHRDLDYISHNYEIQNAELFAKVKYISDKILELEFIGPGYSEEKQLTSFLYEVFTGFNFVNGHTNRDPILELLETI